MSKNTRTKKNKNYMTNAQLRANARAGRKITNQLEKLENRRDVPESDYLTTMKNPKNILEVENLHTYFFTETGVVKAVDGVSFDVRQGRTLGIVGESGCGKSVTSLSIMKLVQRPQGQIVEGEIRLNMGDGKAYDIVKMPTEAMEKIRGNEISMIFQEPMTSLNPVFKVGKQIDEVIQLHNPDMSQEAVKARTLEILELIQIANPGRVYENYPHQLSGGMRQRIVIAIALACNPRLIIADEPTTALDVTIQAQILHLLLDLKEQINSSIMLITHDLGVIAEMADFVVVMYAGRIVETGTAEEIYDTPAHPYTVGLMASKPSMNKDVERLYSIPGTVPNPVDMPNYCYFRDRCPRAFEKCQGPYPPTYGLSENHKVACYHYDEHPIVEDIETRSDDEIYYSRISEEA